MVERSDEEVVASYLAGDQAAFSVLVDRYMNHLYNFVLQFVSDRAAAEDIVQDTFVKAWTHLGRFDRKKSFKTWLFAIAKNTAYDFLKKKKTLPFSLFENEEGENVLENTPGNDTDPGDILDREATSQELEVKLGLLSRPYQILLRLRYQEDFSLHEIAHILKEPYNTVKSRHQRALRQLQTVFLETRVQK
jgi:RNA polymerase sigma-70 factor (ECF subfamily)